MAFVRKRAAVRRRLASGPPNENGASAYPRLALNSESSRVCSASLNSRSRYGDGLSGQNASVWLKALACCGDRLILLAQPSASLDSDKDSRSAAALMSLRCCAVAGED